MKILQVMIHGSAHGFAGGTQKVMVELGNNFARRGHDVLSAYNDTQPGELFFKVANGAKVVNLNSSSRGVLHRFWKILREVSKPLTKSRFGQFFPNPVHLEKARMLSKPLSKVVDDFRPDVILVYGMQDHNSLALGLKGSSHAQIPVIHMVHCEVSSYFNDLNYIDKIRIKNCSAVQALTPEFAHDFGEMVQRQVYSIGNIVEPPLAFVQLDVIKDRKRIMMHSRLDKKKQQDLLLNAFALLKDDFPDWDLVIFGGENTKGYLSKLNHIIDEHKMDEQVKIEKPTPIALEELSRSDIFAFPSVHEEGWGLVLTEAMSVGLPCVGISTTHAVNYLITSENAGLTCSNDISEFANCLRELMSAPQLRNKLGENAKQGVKKYYADEICTQWEELFLSLIKDDTVKV